MNEALAHMCPYARGPHVRGLGLQPAGPESVSPLSPTPSPAGSVGSVGSVASASSGYCSLAHSVPAHAHNALLQLTKYYTFLYVAHELWEQADCLCRLRANQGM